MSKAASGSVTNLAAVVQEADLSGLLRIAHQIIKGHNAFGDLGLGQYEVHDVLFNDKRLHLSEALTVSEILFDHLLRVFISLCKILHI